MSLPQNLGRLSAALTSDASLNIGVGVTPSGSFKLEVGTTSKFTGVATFGSTLSNGTYSYTLPGATGTLALVGGAGVGTVTSVAAITLGTTGTDLSSTVATGTTTPVITLQVPTASAANRGALSSADWSTFNGKQGTITLTTTGTSGAATLSSNTLNIPNYGSALTGYLPLSGGTLTGALSGTTATFSGEGSFSGGLSGVGLSVINTTNARVIQMGYTSGAAYNYIQAYDGTSFQPLVLNNTLTLASTGAATFSSANQALGGAFNTVGNVLISSTDSFAINKGGSLSLGGLYNAAGTPIATFARIHGKKENATVDDTSGYLAFETVPGATANLTERMRITSGGSVGIGTITPTEKLHIYSGGLGPEIRMEGAGHSWYIRPYNDNYNVYTPSGRQAVSYLNNGDVRNYNNTTTWQQTSDVRVKENINLISNAISKILALNPVIFDYKQEFADKNNWDDNKKINNVGFIAQEFETIFPKYVSTNKYEMKETIIDDLKSIDTGHLVPYLVKAIQEQQSQIVELKALIKPIEPIIPDTNTSQ